ncbi:MAG: carboxypeptidase-like regulatory domain-containing protein [Planctomycetes bacterium]|nr:carboxypeptidase-like regulatory domain-containing protein [Planctomycetota bacterium]
MPMSRTATGVLLGAALAFSTVPAAGDDKPKEPAKAASPCTRIVGVVVDRAGKAIGQSQVEIRDHRDSIPSNHPRPLVTGPDGRFTYDGLDASERYRVRATARGFAWGTTEPTTPRVEELKIMLAPAKSLAGRVLDAEAKPLANVEVALRLVEASPAPQATTDPDGKFVISPVGETSGELVAIWRECVDHVCNRKVVVRRPAVSAKDDGLTVAFTKGLVIAGTSVAADGKWVRRIGVQAIPIARATLKGASTDDWCAARFADDGSFRIEGLEKGRYRLVQWSGDANSWSGPAAAEVKGTVEVEAGTTDVVLKLVQPR